VITPTQRGQLLERSPYNVVRVELPDGDYAGAAGALAEWQDRSVLERDSAEALYGYRMTYLSGTGERRSTLGVVGALVLEPPGEGILPHEQTTPKAKTDRLELLRATQANTSPIWCLCSQEGLAEAIGTVPATGVATSLDEAGNEHELWAITDEATQAAIRAVVAGAPLLVADGHHRYETALAYQAEAGAAGGVLPTGQGPGAVMALVVELSPPQVPDVTALATASSLTPRTCRLDPESVGGSLRTAWSGRVRSMASRREAGFPAARARRQRTVPSSSCLADAVWSSSGPDVVVRPRFSHVPTAPDSGWKRWSPAQPLRA
jgi:hypothetical protein